MVPPKGQAAGRSPAGRLTRGQVAAQKQESPPSGSLQEDAPMAVPDEEGKEPPNELPEEGGDEEAEASSGSGEGEGEEVEEDGGGSGSADAEDGDDDEDADKAKSEADGDGDGQDDGDEEQEEGDGEDAEVVEDAAAAEEQAADAATQPDAHVAASGQKQSKKPMIGDRHLRPPPPKTHKTPAKPAVANPHTEIVRRMAKEAGVPLPEEEKEKEEKDKDRQQEMDASPNKKAPTAPKQRPAYETWVLQQAKLVSKQRAKQTAPPTPQPTRNKTHWDHVLAEMEWLAKDFMQERKTKLANAKRFATAVSKSNLSIEARQVAREKEAAEQVRKRAKWIGQQVAGFWGKAQRVVATKVAIVVEARKKAAMDAQLEQIVGQTEKYSKMLASNLVGAQPETLALAAPEPKADTKGAAGADRGVGGKKRSREEAEEHVQGKQEDAMDVDGTPPRAAKQPRIKQEPVEEAAVEATTTRSGSKRTRRSASSAAAAKPAKRGVKREGAANDDDFECDTDEDETDDEETLEQEEAAAAAELGDTKAQHAATKEELNELEEEANLSLEELMAKYGYEVPGENDEVLADPEEEEGEEEEEAAEDGDVEVKKEEGTAIVEEQAGSPGLDELEAEHEDEEGAEQQEQQQDGAGIQHAQKVEGKPVKDDAMQHAKDDELAAAEEQKHQAVKSTGKSVRFADGAKKETGSKKAADGDGDDEDEVEEEPGTMDQAAADAIAAQPTGFTLNTTQVKTKVPFLLKATLREYQHIGLDWLVTIYKKKLNGILADEMGLGKTIQTIALLAHLACEEGCWGPHLVVVPTSVMLNWEMEFKKFCPAFKLLTYYGSAKERKAKRQGWSKPNAFHVCITSYTLVLQDKKMFRQKRWRYLILDEAHMIKNWKSQRWQTLLRFNSKRRLLITGTPLQNDLMELWSLMHFLMPDVFASHSQFKDWFCNPLTGMVEGSEAYNKTLVERLHGVLRPFLLRRMKSEVEKQMPAKHEHVLTCRLSKRQRKLYEEYMSASETQATLASGNFMGVVGVLMQLRKVCNHPDLFEGRPIISAFDMPPLELHMPSCIMHGLVRPLLETEIPLLMSDGIALSPGGWGCSPVASSARALLLAHVSALAAPTVWEAAHVEQLQTTYPAMLSQCGGGYTAPDGKLVYAAPFTEEDADPMIKAAVMSVEALQGDKQAIAAVKANYSELVSTSMSYRVLASSLAAQHSRYTVWRASRLRAAALTNLNRCSAGAPLYGVDLLQLLHDLAHPCSKALSTDSVWVIDHAWVGPSAASLAVWEGAPKPAAAPKKLIEVIDPAASGSAPVAHQTLLPEGGITGAGGGAGEGVAGVQVPVNLTGAQLQGALPAFAGAATSQHGSVALADVPRPYRVRGLRPCQCQLHLPSLVLQVSPTYESRAADMDDVLRQYKFHIPQARTTQPVVWCSRPDLSLVRKSAADTQLVEQEYWSRSEALHTAAVRGTLFFPDRRLIQFDCGKLQEMAVLLRRLKSGGHRCLIFTQMAKMLDILEGFLNLHGHTYVRLDGATKPEQRQVLMTRFNTDTRIFCFILSTRSGGVGINLTGADTVIFYDSDWNPAMDQQAQDRCHRIGQTREVHIYRLVSENTIEENILRKSDQKRQLDWLAIQSGGFNTDILAKLNVRDFFGGDGGGGSGFSADEVKAALRSAEDEADATAAAEAEKEVAAEMDEFIKDPPPTAAKASEDKEDKEDGDDEDEDDAAAGKEGGGGDEDGAAATAEAAAEGGAMVEVAAQVAEGAHADDVLARLEASLKPIEKYAVYLLEEFAPVDVEAAAAAAVSSLGAEGEWKAEEFARRKEEAELAAEDSEELVEDWDTEQATAEYRALADQARRIMEEEEAALAAQAAADAEAMAAAAENGAGFYAEEEAWDADGGWGTPADGMAAETADGMPGVGMDFDMFTAQLTELASKLQRTGPPPPDFSAPTPAAWGDSPMTTRGKAAGKTLTWEDGYAATPGAANGNGCAAAGQLSQQLTAALQQAVQAANVPGAAVPPPLPVAQAQPWSVVWDGPLCSVVDSAVKMGPGVPQPLASLQWNLVADGTQKTLQALNVTAFMPESVTSARCQARYMLLLAAAHAAAHAAAYANPSSPNPLVLDVNARLLQMYARLPPPQLMLVNASLGVPAVSGIIPTPPSHPPAATPLEAMQHQLATLACNLQAQASTGALQPETATSCLQPWAGHAVTAEVAQGLMRSVMAGLKASFASAAAATQPAQPAPACVLVGGQAGWGAANGNGPYMGRPVTTTVGNGLNHFSDA